MSKILSGKEWRNEFAGDFTMQANEIPKDGQGVWITEKRLLYVSAWFIYQIQPGADLDALIDTLEIAVLE